MGDRARDSQGKAAIYQELSSSPTGIMLTLAFVMLVFVFGDFAVAGNFGYTYYGSVFD